MENVEDRGRERVLFGSETYLTELVLLYPIKCVCPKTDRLLNLKR
jgi:hypothetical protein